MRSFAAAWCLFWCSVGAGAPVSGAATPVDKPAAPLVEVAEHTLHELRMGAAVVAKGDYLYVIGGGDGREGSFGSTRVARRKVEDGIMRTRDPGITRPTVLDSIERIDLRTGASEFFGKLIRPRLWHRAVLVGERVYVLGGHSPGGDGQPFEQSVEVLDLATGETSIEPVSQPDPRANFGCVELAGKIYVIGGRRRAGPDTANTNTVTVLDLATGQWADGPPMPTPRQCDAAVVTGGFIVVPGGFDGKRSLTTVEVFDPRNAAWRTLPPLSRETSAHSVVFLDHHVFLFGDYHASGSMLAYDLLQKRSEVFSINRMIARHTSAVTHDGRVYVVGGKLPSDQRALDRVHVFAPEAESKPSGPASDS